MPADVGKKKTAIERFFHWALTSDPADKLLTEDEKRAQGNSPKDEAWKEIDKDLSADPTPEPTPEPTPMPTPTTNKKKPVNIRN